MDAQEIDSILERIDKLDEQDFEGLVEESLKLKRIKKINYQEVKKFEKYLMNNPLWSNCTKKLAIIVLSENVENIKKMDYYRELTKEKKLELITAINKFNENIKMILNPNCSEAVFKLSGSLDEIKSEVLKMLDIIEEDYRKDTDMKDKQSREWYHHLQKRLQDKRDEIKNIKHLDEFKMVVFPFTVNYETFFKPDKDNNLMVATCSNTDWDDLNKEGISDEYYSIANCNYYDLVCKGKEWVRVKRIDGGKINLFNFEPINGEMLKIDNDEINVKVINVKAHTYIVLDRKIEVREITDKEKLNQIDKALVVKRLE